MLQRLKTYDFTLLFAPIALVSFGTVMVYSASMVYGPVVLNVPSNYYLIKQLQWMVLGIIVLFLISMFPYRHLKRLSKLSVLLMVISLVGLFFFGIKVNNAQSWYDLGPMNFQPAEFVKIGIIIYLASVYANKRKYIGDFAKAVLPPLVIISLILGLIIMQPDIGSAAIIGLLASVMIMSSGIKGKHIVLLVVVTGGILLMAGSQLVTDERLNRFSGAYQPFESPQSDGYHLIQSYVAIATGGLTGEGLGQGVQKLGYLPEPHTDFIMAVIAEELGFIGVVITVGLLATIVLRGLYISWRCKDAFGSLLALGISSLFAIQAFINLGAMSGLLPITGVTLPLVSYGGSSLLIMMASLGILNNIARTVKVKEEVRQETYEPLREQPVHRTKQQGVRRWQS
ncbi:putative lipid II flippase FtsW [Halobacillus amylolyticus]|uniref:Probable peptidoglycan glycosyltransferase FtsW n=1 Tax=Halobacillus amylolyticus TaxID=2932259 RepID=A0ABY4HGG8_9BACI|nr:putative lipid II flippase FtsW [Halobacillus amylolyticus]UOR12960.1 putative lipid II flippase FtsW [Halobacillus amylolyticus]